MSKDVGRIIQVGNDRILFLRRQPSLREGNVIGYRVNLKGQMIKRFNGTAPKIIFTFDQFRKFAAKSTSIKFINEAPEL